MLFVCHISNASSAVQQVNSNNHDHYTFEQRRAYSIQDSQSHWFEPIFYCWNWRQSSVMTLTVISNKHAEGIIFWITKPHAHTCRYACYPPTTKLDDDSDSVRELKNLFAIHLLQMCRHFRTILFYAGLMLLNRRLRYHNADYKHHVPSNVCLLPILWFAILWLRPIFAHEWLKHMFLIIEYAMTACDRDWLKTSDTITFAGGRKKVNQMLKLIRKWEKMRVRDIKNVLANK